MQDEVAAARLRIGYLAARQKDFKKAREIFVEAEEKYKGEGSMGSDFGGLKDQAALHDNWVDVASGLGLMGVKRLRKAHPEA